QVQEYREALEGILIREKNGLVLMPELYAVPPEKLKEEIKHRLSCLCSPLIDCAALFQSMYGRQVSNGLGFGPGFLFGLLGYFLFPHLCCYLTVLAESNQIKNLLQDRGINVQSIADIHPLRVQPARILSNLYTMLGKYFNMESS
ncbi:KPB2 kinase, partial [Mystacornis crossleyi]|nr:KPB2 kinase [Mystacornis crossleyi]